MTDVKERLGQSIEQFIADAALVHEFTKGDKNTLVTGEDGQYPSQAKIAFDIQTKFDDLFARFSSMLKLTTTKPIPIIAGKIQLPSQPLGDLVHNEARVYLDLTGIDFTASGMLKGNRDYLVEEHVNVIVDGSTAIFTNATQSIEGRFAVVSYIAI